MRDPEGVVHVGVLALHELEHEGRVVRLLPRREAEILEKLDPRHQLVEPRPDRLEAEGRVRLPSGTAEVGQAVMTRTVVAQPGKCRQRGPDPEVVGDDPAATRASRRSGR